MPENTVYVGRPIMWGNPWRFKDERHWGNGFVVLDPDWTPRPLRHYCEGPKAARALSVEKFRAWATSPFLNFDLAPLRGKNLACFCPLDQPCHADVLLEIANAT